MIKNESLTLLLKGRISFGTVVLNEIQLDHMKTEKLLFNLVTYVGMIGVGGSMGYFVGIIHKNTETESGPWLFLTELVLTLAVIVISYFINIFLHEIGHMLFGLLAGYKFNSIRFGKLMIVNKDGKLHLCRFHMPGTAGQCIMTIPEGYTDRKSFVLYNLGGLIMNLDVLIIGGILFLLLKDSQPIAAITCLAFAMTALLFLITNGLPFMSIGTDGSNTIILYRDKNARVVFKKQLEVVRLLADNYSICEMPEELFFFDKTMPIDNALITAQAVNYYNYLSAHKNYDEAKEMAWYILNNAKCINQLHEKILYGELIFQAAVIDQHNDDARTIYHAHKKDIDSAATFITIQSVLYAYYTLVESDQKKKDRYARLFENSLQHYPYPKDAAIEKEQFDMVTELCY